MPADLDPPRLMVYEPRADGEWRHGFFLGAFRMEPAPADVAAWLAAQPAEAARAVVRAYLARDPEAAAKVAGAWVDPHGHGERSVRLLPGTAYGWQRQWNRVAEVQPYRGNAERFGWLGQAYALRTEDNEASVVRPTRAECEAAVDALLAADGWVLGMTGEEMDRG